MKGMTSVTVGLALGLAVGAAGRLTMRSSDSDSGGLKAVSHVAHENDQRARDDRDEGLSAPRPTLEQALAAKGFQKQLLMGRYLREATIEEVLGLLERSFDQKELQAIWPAISMIRQRGLALDPKAILALIEEHDEHGFRLVNLFLDWAKIDVEAAMVASEGRSKRVLEAVLIALSETDPDRALTLLEEEGLATKTLRARIAMSKTQKLLETDLQAALKHALGLARQGQQNSALATVLIHWTEEAPGAALEWIRGASANEIPNRGHLLEKILPKMAESQPSKVQEYLNELPMTSMRGKLEGSILKRLASKDFDAAVQRVRAYPKGAFRDHLFNEVVNSGNPPENLLSLINELEVDVQNVTRLIAIRVASDGWGSSSMGNPDNLRQAAETLLSKKMLESPERTMQTAFVTFGDGREHQFQELAENLMKQWSSQDAKAAAEWTLALPEGKLASSLQQTSVGNWASSDPEGAASTLHQHGALAEASVRRELAKAWSRQDPTGLLDWAESLPAESRDLLLPEAIKSVAEHVPQEAAERIDAIATMQEQQSVVESVGRQWGNRAPQEALDWMQQQPEETAIGSTMKATTKAWVLKEPEEASTWIGAMEPGSRRDHAVAGMVHALVSSTNPQRDFDSASVWVDTIVDPELKAQWVAEIQKRQAKESPAPPTDAGGAIIQVDIVP